MFYMISSCEQTVKVRDKEFHLKDTESIFFGISRKFSQNEIEELTINALDVKLVKFFDDKNKYFRENIFIK